jgi:hypothetical protein
MKMLIMRWKQTFISEVLEALKGSKAAFEEKELAVANLTVCAIVDHFAEDMVNKCKLRTMSSLSLVQREKTLLRTAAVSDDTGLPSNHEERVVQYGDSIRLAKLNVSVMTHADNPSSMMRICAPDGFDSVYITQ